MAEAYYSATYTPNKKNGGWLLRVETKPGLYPTSPVLAVKMKNGEMRKVLIQHRLWSGVDKESGNEIHLCTFLEIASFPSRQESI